MYTIAWSSTYARGKDAKTFIRLGLLRVNQSGTGMQKVKKERHGAGSNNTAIKQKELPPGAATSPEVPP